MLRKWCVALLLVGSICLCCMQAYKYIQQPSSAPTPGSKDMELHKPRASLHSTSGTPAVSQGGQAKHSQFPTFPQVFLLLIFFGLRPVSLLDEQILPQLDEQTLQQLLPTWSCALHVNESVDLLNVASYPGLLFCLFLQICNGSQQHKDVRYVAVHSDI